MADVLAVSRGPLSARVEVPGSKSIANRALICAALAEGVSHLTHMAPGDDTEAMRECLGALGIAITDTPNGVEVRGTGGRVTGGATISARLAGTTSRFMIAVAALGVEATTVSGFEALRRRPIEPLRNALRSLGAEVGALEADSALPVRVARAELRGGRVEMRGDVSSQFLSALMLIAPLLADGLRIDVTTPLISVPYLRITAQVMEAFGIEGIEIGPDRITIPEGRYRSRTYTIEPDASSASYPLAAAAICGGQVSIPGLDRDALQGDVGFFDLLAEMGCRVEHDSSGVTVIGAEVLRGITVDLRDMSDLVPTVAALAVFAASPTTISGVGFIRLKESDRLGDLARGLQSLGCDVTETADGMIIRPVPATDLVGTGMPTHHDHRLAMAWSLIALRVPGISIEDPGVVSKSWPNWWSVRSELVASSTSSPRGE